MSFGQWALAIPVAVVCIACLAAVIHYYRNKKWGSSTCDEEE